MLIVLVRVKVLPDCVDAFKAATRANAAASRKEPGIARFDVLQRADDPTIFILNEVYRSQEATVAHKETDHYKTWRDTVAPMMAEPRASEKFSNVDPIDAEWS